MLALESSENIGSPVCVWNLLETLGPEAVVRALEMHKVETFGSLRVVPEYFAKHWFPVVYSGWGPRYGIGSIATLPHC